MEVNRERECLALWILNHNYKMFYPHGLGTPSEKWSQNMPSDMKRICVQYQGVILNRIIQISVAWVKSIFVIPYDIIFMLFSNGPLGDGYFWKRWLYKCHSALSNKTPGHFPSSSWLADDFYSLSGRPLCRYIQEALFSLLRERVHWCWQWDDSRDVCRLRREFLQDQIGAISLRIIEDHQWKPGPG